MPNNPRTTPSFTLFTNVATIMIPEFQYFNSPLLYLPIKTYVSLPSKSAEA